MPTNDFVVIKSIENNYFKLCLYFPPNAHEWVVSLLYKQNAKQSTKILPVLDSALATFDRLLTTVELH